MFAPGMTAVRENTGTAENRATKLFDIYFSNMLQNHASEVLLLVEIGWIAILQHKVV